MQTIKQLVLAVLITTAGVTAIPTLALAAAGEPQQQGFAHGADYATFQMDRYRDEIARMSPEDRTKLMAMQDKLMQMEMDQASAHMKMEMEMAKVKRDMQMFIYSARKGQAVN